MVEIHFDEELKLLKHKLLRMAGMAQEMIGLAIRSLVERDGELAGKVSELEKLVNRTEVEIEDETIRLMARRQPIAGDLRLLVAVLKINSDIERVADQACNISETVLFLLKEPQLKPLIDIPNMARIVQAMIRDSIDAFVNHDSNQAQQVCRRDDEVDRINDQVFRELLTYMMEDPKSITRAVDLILVSRNLERIADHATNIGEEVIFIEEGKNVRHHLRDEPSPA